MEENHTRIIFCETLPAHGPQAGRKNQWGGKMGGAFTTIMQPKDQQSTDLLMESS